MRFGLRFPPYPHRVAKWSAIFLGVLLICAAIPVAWIETRCVVSSVKPPNAFSSQLPKSAHRQEINSYLTYPEWSIVHAYEDLAAVTRQRSESDFDYVGAIKRYWTSLCRISKMASSRDQISSEYKILLHVIGLSFAGEMGVKGAYEKTLGRITAWLRGPTRTPEDAFALAVADDYAAFLRQTPWYEYPFATKLVQFWRDTPLVGGNIIRKIERRFALTLEWGAKSIYAQLLGLGAAAAPAPLRIQSVVKGLTQADLDSEPRIKRLQTLPSGQSVIETDRYRTFTQIIQVLASRERAFTEIAGNQNILVTVLAPAKQSAFPAGAVELFQVPVSTRPGWRRIALDVKVPELLSVIRECQRAGWILEHVYDY
jgi:hypothetical protein